MLLRYSGEGLLAVVGRAPLCGLLFMKAAIRPRRCVAERAANSLGRSRVGRGGEPGKACLCSAVPVGGRAARTWGDLRTVGVQRRRMADGTGSNYELSYNLDQSSKYHRLVPPMPL